MEKKELLKKIFQDNGLEKEDVFKKEFKDGKSFVIITRTGIEKIQAIQKYKVTFELSFFPEVSTFVCKAQCYTDNKFIETYGEASPQNCTTSYLVAMAEKRALSRAVLKMVGLYELGVFGEDESEEFKK